MTRRPLPLTALGLLLAPAVAPALPCPPPWPAPVWWSRPVVVVCAPPPVVFDPCWCPPVVYAAPVTPPAVQPTAPAAPPPTTAEPATPKAPPRVEAESATPFKPVVPATDKAADPLAMPPLVLPAAPPPKSAPTPAAPTAPKGLDLNPVNPGGPELPPLPLPVPKESRTSFSSPLSAAAFSVRLVPAAGPPPASPDAPRRVVFVNLTASEVVLTVAGESAVLPARHELTATVPANFSWRLNGGELRTDDVPAAAPGAEVVIR